MKDEKFWKYGYAYYEATASEIKNSVPKGWWGLMDKIFENLPDDASVGQVKEKWGTLRFSTYNVSEEVQSIIDDAEKQSSYTCAFCSKQPAITEWHKGWMITLCEKCGEEYDKE